MANLLDTSSAKSAVALSAGATAFEPTRAILVTVAGTATVSFVNDDGTIALGSLAVGLYPFSIDKFTAGTATIIGLY